MNNARISILGITLMLVIGLLININFITNVKGDPWTNLDGGDYGGDDWTPGSGAVIAGVHTNINTFTILEGYTIYVEDYNGTDYGSLEIHANEIIIYGSLIADGAGFRGGYGGIDHPGDDGEGPGYGHGGQNGGGGAGFGGKGGDSNNPGGVIYGTTMGEDVFMGSGGGGGGDDPDPNVYYLSPGPGGDGGGSINLITVGTITISGSISAKGDDPNDYGSEGGGGGGSGGAIVLKAEIIEINENAVLSVDGGGGGGHTINHMKGGGGAGGRVKLFGFTVKNEYSDISVTGGKGAWSDDYEHVEDGEDGTIYIENENQNPMAELSVDKSTSYLGESVTFNGNSSNDNDYNDSIEQYFFDFGDGQNTGWITDSYISYTYSNTGVYTASLIVKDSYGFESTNDASIEITISDSVNQPPTASANANPISGYAPLVVSFTGSGSDSDGTIASYYWVFGDGSTSTLQNPSHTYNNAGSYTATLTVTDDDGATGTDTITIAVSDPSNQNPSASASASPTSGYASLIVSFTGSGSDSDGTIASYYWVFGDGSTSTLQNPSHTYNNAGSYTATLTVTDDDGATGTDTITIAVNNPSSDNDGGDGEKDSEETDMTPIIGIIAVLIIMIIVTLIVMGRKGKSY